MNKYLLVSIAALAVTGCASSAVMEVAPAVTTYAANRDEIPGRWAVIVETDAIPNTYESSEFTCSTWSYSVDAQTAFEESVLSSLETAFQEIRPADRLLTGAQAQADDLMGTITVTVDRMDADLQWLTGFWTQKARSTASMRIGVDVRDHNGDRIAGFSEGSQRSAEADQGGCGAGSEAIARAISSATEDLMEQSLERLLDNNEIRGSAATAR